MATSNKKPAISANMKQVEKILKEIPEDRRALGNSLYDELAFMNSTLTKLKEQILEYGAVDYFKQGSQEFWRESPALTSYQKVIQRYNQTFKQLIDLLPESGDKKESDALMDFIKE